MYLSRRAASITEVIHYTLIITLLLLQQSYVSASSNLSYRTFTTGVNVSPSIPNLATVEGGGGDGDGGSDTGEGSDGGGGGGDGTGGSGAGDGEVMVCLELTEGNLQRNITLTAMTVSSPTSTGKRVDGLRRGS